MRYIGKRKDLASVAPRGNVCNVYIENAGGLWLSGVMVGLKALFDFIRESILSKYIGRVGATLN